ncbi:MAG: hypothetical protein M3547_01030 [Acidobacteriota bacterium]|nr:hypothetical protein [Acidobacteriota bacterium]
MGTCGLFGCYVDSPHRHESDGYVPMTFDPAPPSTGPDLVAIAQRLHAHDRPESKFQRLQNRAFEAVKRMPKDELADLHPDSWLADALRELERTGPCQCGQLFLGVGE